MAAKKLTLAAVPDKASKAEEPKKKVAEPKAPAEPEFKYGVSDLADMLELKPASVRVQLRNAGIKKAGRSYGWNTKSELEAVAKSIRAEKPAKAEKTAKTRKAKDEDEDEE